MYQKIIKEGAVPFPPIKLSLVADAKKAYFYCLRHTNLLRLYN